MKTSSNPTPIDRRDMMIQEEIHDPYKAAHKLSEPTVCPTWQAVYAKGRWQWMDAVSAGAKEVVCPACHRTADDYPAGVVTLYGNYFFDHKDEILNLVRNIEEVEKRQHPLQRIMSIEEDGVAVVIKTTGLHVGRRIAHALECAHKGTLDTHYDEEGYFIRIDWWRDD